ncbi:MAG: tRNA pseudouridine-54 N-methylase [Gammaproteobacteria bacterium]|jgi:tRNA pseudouridine-54 N-methylase
MKFQQVLAVTMIVSGMSMVALASGMPDATKTNIALRLSEPSATDAQSETFGALLDKRLKKVTLHELTSYSSSYVSNAFQVETKVAKVCQKKGCFFIAQEGDDVMRVAFRDYGFFVPTDIAGKTVRLVGKLIKKEMTAEQITHFNQDMQGGSDILQEGAVYEILADSVVIPRA